MYIRQIQTLQHSPKKGIPLHGLTAPSEAAATKHHTKRGAENNICVGRKEKTNRQEGRIQGKSNHLHSDRQFKVSSRGGGRMAVTKPAQSPELNVHGTEGDIHYLRVYIRHGPGVH